jgi:hypothetical protein
MRLTFVPLNEAALADVCGLLVRVWGRDWSEELAESYFARGSGETLRVCDRGRCVSILDSFIRPYWIAGPLEMVRETSDWFCLRLLDVDKFVLPVSARTAAMLVAHRLWRRSAALARIIPDFRWVHLIPCKTPPSANVQVRR